MLIGSDIVFKPEDFFSILESPHDVTSGMYLKKPSAEFNEPVFEGINVGPSDVGSEQYVKVKKCALGWTLIRKGVLEANDSTEFEEVYVDTTIRVGHSVEIVI